MVDGANGIKQDSRLVVPAVHRAKNTSFARDQVGFRSVLRSGYQSPGLTRSDGVAAQEFPPEYGSWTSYWISVLVTESWP